MRCLLIRAPADRARVNVHSLWFLICGMALVTYLTRVTPFAIGHRRLPAPAERLLRYVPAAAVGALIFPDALAGADGYWYASLVAVAVASAVALRTRALWITVGAAIAITYLVIRFVTP
ncbi:MAG: AzlD domain-containing protein [Spirochaetaceae bacterium]|nr:MAG: AzlD domain-containing protein [Spirochaetaceae bacterium]